MKQKHLFSLCIIIIALLIAGTMEEECVSWAEEIEAGSERAILETGTQKQKGFINDNVLHSDIGDIHFSSYIPETYNGSEPYALFITLPGWEGLYFQGVGQIW